MRRRRKNVTIIHNEIDYDKLAEAIVRAQQRTADESQKVGIISCALSDMISLCLRLLSICAFPVSIGIGVCTWKVIANSLPENGWLRIFLYVIDFIVSFGLSFGLGVFAATFWKAATEIKRETDRNYIVAVFAGLVSFAALVVALVALIKG